jgi:putative transposase
MPCQVRLDVPGTLHHVILRGIEKRWIVNDVADRKNFEKHLESYLPARRPASIPGR